MMTINEIRARVTTPEVADTIHGILWDITAPDVKRITVCTPTPEEAVEIVRFLRGQKVHASRNHRTIVIYNHITEGAQPEA